MLQYLKHFELLRTYLCLALIVRRLLRWFFSRLDHTALTYLTSHLFFFSFVILVEYALNLLFDYLPLGQWSEGHSRRRFWETASCQIQLMILAPIVNA